MGMLKKKKICNKNQKSHFPTVPNVHLTPFCLLWWLGPMTDLIPQTFYQKDDNNAIYNS